MQFKEYLTKLQGLSDKQKKIVLWTVVVVLGLIMGFFWIRGTMNRLSGIGNQLGQVQLPQIDIPDVDSILETTTPSDQSILQNQ